MRYRFFIFFFNDTATTEIYTLSLHDALPICVVPARTVELVPGELVRRRLGTIQQPRIIPNRSEEHTSELQSHSDLVCRLLLEKKKKRPNSNKLTTQSALDTAR